jgi:hypothetical protein
MVDGIFCIIVKGIASSLLDCGDCFLILFAFTDTADLCVNGAEFCEYTVIDLNAHFNTYSYFHKIFPHFLDAFGQKCSIPIFPAQTASPRL